VTRDGADVVEQIEELLRALEDGTGAPPLARIEDTLTEGYAQALALEAERWRLERRLGEVARTVDGDPSGAAGELVEIATRLESADGELSRLRGLLGTLHARVRSARLAATS
jgi:hypothetical protein